MKKTTIPRKRLKIDGCTDEMHMVYLVVSGHNVFHFLSFFFPLWWGLKNVAAVYHSALRYDIRQVICGTEWVTSQRYQAAVDGLYAAETIGAALP